MHQQMKWPTIHVLYLKSIASPTFVWQTYVMVNGCWRCCFNLLNTPNGIVFPNDQWWVFNSISQRNTFIYIYIYIRYIHRSHSNMIHFRVSNGISKNHWLYYPNGSILHWCFFWTPLSSSDHRSFSVAPLPVGTS